MKGLVLFAFALLAAGCVAPAATPVDPQSVVDPATSMPAWVTNALPSGATTARAMIMFGRYAGDVVGSKLMRSSAGRRW